MPRQMPRSGVPRAARSRMTVSRPWERSAAMPAPNAPTPGRTMRAASRTLRDRPVTTTLALSRRKAPAIDARFATPEIHDHHVTHNVPFVEGTSSKPEAPQPVGERARSPERGFGAVMVVVTLQHVHVQRCPARRGERAQYMSDVLRTRAADSLPAQPRARRSETAGGEIHDRPSQPVVERCEAPADFPTSRSGFAPGGYRRARVREHRSCTALARHGEPDNVCTWTC